MPVLAGLMTNGSPPGGYLWPEAGVESVVVMKYYLTVGWFSYVCETYGLAVREVLEHCEIAIARGQELPMIVIVEA